MYAKRQTKLNRKDTRIADFRLFIEDLFRTVMQSAHAPSIASLLLAKNLTIVYEMSELRSDKTFEYKIMFKRKGEPAPYERFKDYTQLDGSFHFNHRMEPDFEIHKEYIKYADKDFMWFGFALMAIDYWAWVERNISENKWLN